MTRQVRTSPGAVHDLGYRLVRCPKCRRPVLGGRVKTRLEELIGAKGDEHGRRIAVLEVMPGHVHLLVKAHPKNSPPYLADRFRGFTSHHVRAEFPHPRSGPPTLRSRSFFVAVAGAVSAGTVRRRIGTRYERAPEGGGRA
ncbi:putative transposase [Sinosporangium album]|uniref:Putative transposase n=1 Tax=Sinosporangium album TaxID=504805 RepID=A0A1G8GQ14_9ACTN|nr:IS200/IS605 family transposase [Sinosporangium album]SDH96423.1 putative transposase [Sinosporangium album]